MTAVTFFQPTICAGMYMPGAVRAPAVIRGLSAFGDDRADAGDRLQAKAGLTFTSENEAGIAKRENLAP